MIGPLIYPGRYPPSREPRPPVFERRVKRPVGWLVERLTAGLARWEQTELRTPEVAIPVPQLAVEFTGYRIALVTDLHRGPAVPAWWLERAAERAAALAPDLVALGGDFVSHARSDLAGLPAIVARFRAPDGVVAVLGNHDHWVDPGAVMAAVREGGAHVLLNAHRLIRRGGAAVAVAGVDDFTHGAVRPDDALAAVSPDTPRVLLSHNPDLIEYLSTGLRVDVMLSGHTHNGQLHFPWFGPLTVPSQFGGRYLHGLHRHGATWLYVSAGVGTASIPLRWGNPPELPVIRLEQPSAVSRQP